MWGVWVAGGGVGCGWWAVSALGGREDMWAVRAGGGHGSMWVDGVGGCSGGGVGRVRWGVRVVEGAARGWRGW